MACGKVDEDFSFTFHFDAHHVSSSPFPEPPASSPVPSSMHALTPSPVKRRLSVSTPDLRMKRLQGTPIMSTQASSPLQWNSNEPFSVPSSPQQQQCESVGDLSNSSDSESDASTTDTNPGFASEISTFKPERSSKITSFFRVATEEEKQEANQSEFQQVRDQQDNALAEEARERQRKVARGRASARERQQAHRDRSKEKKLKAGWEPGQKRVRFLYVSICTFH